MSHVNRESNSAAHRLAKPAIKHVIDKVWIEEIPPSICDIVVLENMLFLIDYE